MIHSERIQVLNNHPEPPATGRFVLYWMQQAQRAEYNHALEYAIREANSRHLPVVVLFGVTDGYPEANERHYAFLMEGMRDVQAALQKRGIRFLMRHRSPEHAAVETAREACLLVTDRGFLRIQKQWRKYVAEYAPCPVIQVETDSVVPVETASPGEEYAARTLRPKIHRLWDLFLVPLSETTVERPSLGLTFKTLSPPDELDAADVDGTLARLRIDRTIGRVRTFRGGPGEAHRLLAAFIAQCLQHYAGQRNEPGLNFTSHMSPYLHFGHISPLHIALQIAAIDVEAGHMKGTVRNPLDENRSAFLEELIIRRELSLNFVHYNPHYETFACLPNWAQRTLKKHEADPRPVLYTKEVLEQARTDDPFWNTAQKEMIRSGKMANYMRMYWAKKILEWTRTPEEAFGTLLALNNRYFLDGRDPNSFANVAWCFGKHDRPWMERPIFGTVRYMNAAGLQRKFDMESYFQRVESLSSA